MVKEGSERENGRLSTMDSIESQLVFQDEDKSEIEDEEDNEDLTPRIGMDLDDDDNSEQRLIRQALESIPSISKHLRSPEHNGTTLRSAIEDDPKYWGAISSPLAVGWLDIAVKMFHLHGSYQLDQLGNPEQLVKEIVAHKMGELGLKEKDVGSISSKDMFFRADKIYFKSWDLQLEKHLSRVWSRDKEVHSKREEWEIDLAKLDIRNVIAHGTYGTVYRGTYDGQDVADGEDGIATAAETAALRASFRQEVVVWHKLDHPNVTKFIGASMGTSNLKIPSDNTSSDAHNSLPSRACCVVVEYLPGGTLKKYLIRNWRKKLAFGVVIQLALDLSKG
ncbi:unnamed protein product [Camellia sinensis]